MASIRVRKETGCLMVDFRYGGQRHREQTALEDSPKNRKRLERFVRQMEQEIRAGTFEYGRFFPGSPNQVSAHSPGADNGAGRGSRTPRGGPSTPTLQAFYEQWREEKAPEWRQSYRESVETTFTKHVLPFFDVEKGVGDLTKEDIYAFRAHLAKDRPEQARTLSASSINRTLKILRMMLDEAADRYQFKSPFAGVKLLKEPKKHIEPFSLDEIQRILDNVRPDFREYFLVRFFTGLRSGEAHGLKWEHVDFERRQLLIRETYVDGRTEYTKNDGSQREVFMSALVYEALQTQYARTGQGEYVFTTAHGSPLNNHNLVRRIWAPLLRYLGLPYRRPYNMRHTAATLWLSIGESPEWIARQLGHTSTEMLFKTYSRYMPNATRQDGSAIDQLLRTSVRIPGQTKEEGESNHD